MRQASGRDGGWRCLLTAVAFPRDRRRQTVSRGTTAGGGGGGAGEGWVKSRLTWSAARVHAWLGGCRLVCSVDGSGIPAFHAHALAGVRSKHVSGEGWSAAMARRNPQSGSPPHCGSVSSASASATHGLEPYRRITLEHAHAVCPTPSVPEGTSARRLPSHPAWSRLTRFLPRPFALTLCHHTIPYRAHTTPRCICSSAPLARRRRYRYLAYPHAPSPFSPRIEPAALAVLLRQRWPPNTYAARAGTYPSASALPGSPLNGARYRRHSA